MAPATSPETVFYPMHASHMKDRDQRPYRDFSVIQQCFGNFMTIQVLNEIRALAGSGVDIGSHTVNHLWLGKTKDSVVIKELQDSKKALEDILGQEVPHFAYPFGSWNLPVRDAVIEAGDTGACSTISGRNHKGIDPYILRRSEIKGSDSPWQFRLKLKFATNDMPPISDARYLVSQTLKKWS